MNHQALTAQARGSFPQVTSSNLEKKTFHLPQDYAGERNLLFVAFTREQQKDIDTWLAEIKQFQAADPHLAYYELPTIDKLNPFTRWFINTGMRNGIPDRGARERTITLYIDKKPFEDSLAIPNESTIYIFVVDRSGAVLWRNKGSYDFAKGKELLAFLHPAKP